MTLACASFQLASLVFRSGGGVLFWGAPVGGRFVLSGGAFLLGGFVLSAGCLSAGGRFALGSFVLSGGAFLLGAFRSGAFLSVRGVPFCCWGAFRLGAFRSVRDAFLLVGGFRWGRSVKGPG